jgi:hypothetical protein
MRKRRWYSSFLIRYWILNGEHRIQIEHIQSRTQAQLSTLAAAIEWIEAHSAKPLVAPAETGDAEPVQVDRVPTHDDVEEPSA